MCEITGHYDGDRPTVFSETKRRARKPYKCYECDGAIAQGERYNYVFGVWDGSADTYRFCAACDATLEAFAKAHPGLQHLFGGLDEELKDCIREETRFDDDDNEIVSESGQRWQLALDEMRARRAAAKAVHHE